MDRRNKDKNITSINIGREIYSHSSLYIGARTFSYGVRPKYVNDDTQIQAEEMIFNDPITYESFDSAPYINTEWYDPIHHISEDVVIEYFVTDRNQEDYFKNLYNKYFLVIVDFNGKICRRKVKAGQHLINLGKPDMIGENYFSIQCIDMSNGFESCKHYKHLKVVDDSYEITSNQTYNMTSADLTKYSIVYSTGAKVSDEIGHANIDGINALLADVRAAGFRKIVFYNPNGDANNRYTYFLQPYNTREHPVIIPDGLTVDLNKCKWKQLVSYGGGSLLVKFTEDSQDCHIVNGYVWGDYDEHIVNTNDPNYPNQGSTGIEGEGYNLISLSGAYNSIENLDAGWCTGYSICSGGNKSALGDTIQTFTNGYIDFNGEDKESDIDIWTCGYVFINDTMKTFKYLQANPYAGYSGLCGNVNDEYFTYYDNDKNFIKREKIRQYGLSLIPENARYVRLTLQAYDVKDIVNVSAAGFRLQARNFKDTTCWLAKNVFAHDCRTVAFATGIYDHLTFDDVIIEGCGQWLGAENGQVTALAIDVEDGYQHSEALYIKNVDCHASPVHGLGSDNVNLVTTYDVHVYGDCKCSISAYRTFGLKLTNTSISNGIMVGRGKHQVVGFMMIQDSNISGHVIFLCNDVLTDPDTLIKYCTINAQVNTYSASCTYRVTFSNCELTRQPRGSLSVLDEVHKSCLIYIVYPHILNGSSSYHNCIIDTPYNTSMRLNSENKVVFTNCDIKCRDDLANSDATKGIGRLLLYDCRLYDSSYTDPSRTYIVSRNCKVIEE